MPRTDTCQVTNSHARHGLRCLSCPGRLQTSWPQQRQREVTQSRVWLSQAAWEQFKGCTCHVGNAHYIQWNEDHHYSQTAHSAGEQASRRACWTCVLAGSCPGDCIPLLSCSSIRFFLKILAGRKNNWNKICMGILRPLLEWKSKKHTLEVIMRINPL